MNSVQVDLLSGFILIAIGVVLFSVAVIAHKYIEVIESRLSNCPYIEDNKRVWSGAGLLGKVMRGGMISMVLVMPKMHARRGLIDTQELSRLPRLYKYLLVVPFITCCVLLVFLIVLSVVEKYVA